MSSTSLSLAPSESSSWRTVHPPARPISLAVPYTSFVETSRSGTRRRENQSDLLQPPIPKRRHREPTPICEDNDESTSGDRSTAAQNASAAPYTTTVAGPSSYTAQEDDPGKVAESSEGGEGSVLFSEQAIVQGKTQGRTPKSRSRTGRAIGVGRPDGLTSGGDFIPEDPVNEGEMGDDGEEEDEGQDEDDNPAHEESQDQNDVAEDEEDGAEAPPWLKQPHPYPHAALAGPSKPHTIDQMNRVLECNAKSTIFRPHAHTHRSRHPAENDQEPESDGTTPLPGSYYSGDSEAYDMAHRPILERTEIKRDIMTFVESLGDDFRERSTGELMYKVVDRLGEGTQIEPACLQYPTDASN